MDHNSEITTPLDHPCYSGHFPGNPIFPGVLQLESLAQAGGIAALADERGIEPAAAFVEQQRILAWPLGHDALRESRHEHDAERSTARLVRRPDEQTSVTAGRRLPVE